MLTTESMDARAVVDRIAAHRGKNLRVLGLPGSGKTHGLVERFRSLEGSSARVAAITYGRAQHDDLAGKMLVSGTCRIGGVPVFTFPSLARRVVEVGRGARRGPLSEFEEHMLLDAAFDGVRSSLESDYARIDGSSVFRRIILSIIHELQQSGWGVVRSGGADGEANEQGGGPAGRAAIGRGGSPRTRDILRVFRAYSSLLEKHGVYTFAQSPWLAARAVRAHPSQNPLAGFDAVLVDDFGDVDAGQFAMLLAMVPPGGDASISVFGDPSGARFSFRGTSSRFLLHEYPAHYSSVDVRLPAVYPHGEGVREAVGTLEVLARPEAKDDELLTRTAPRTSGTLASCVRFRDSMSEARWIAARVGDTMDACDDGPAAFAVIVRNPASRAQEFSTAFAERGIPFSVAGTGRFALDEFVLDSLRLMSSEPGHADRTALLNSPYYALLRDSLAAELRLGGRRVDRDAQEDWESRQVLAELFRRSTHRDRFVMDAFLRVAVRPVIKGLAVMDGDIPRGVTSIMRAWERYESMCGRMGCPASPGGFVSMYRRFSPAVTHGDRRAVVLISPREAAAHHWKSVFVAGLADGEFPAWDRPRGYIPWSDLRRASGVAFDGGRSADEREHAEYALLLTALTRATHKISLTTSVTHNGRDLAAPVAPIANLFPDTGPESVPKSMTWRAAHAVIAAEQEFGQAPPAGASVVEQLVLRARPEPNAFSVPPFPVSASRIGEWYTCPRRLFYGRVLGMRVEPGVSARIGRMLHAVLERIGSRYPERADRVARGQAGDFDQIIHEVCTAESALPPHSIVAELSERTLRSYVDVFLQFEQERGGTARIVDVETDVAFEYDGVRIAGIVDRVDGDDALVVIDYKTSSNLWKTGKSILAYATEDDPAKRLWQIPLYVWGAKQRYGRWPDTFCYYWFVPKGEPMMVGLHVHPDAPGNGGLFPLENKRFGRLDPEEVEALVRQAADTSQEIFSQRTEFTRTDIVASCRYCDFARLCQRVSR